MSGVHNVARSILKWFSALYVVAIIVQVFLAGEDGPFSACSHFSNTLRGTVE